MKMDTLIYRVLNELNSGSISDDNSYSEEMIASIINSSRAKLIRQERNAGKSISGMYIQDLGRVKLINADTHNCTIIDNCILRSENQVPKFIDTNGVETLTFFGTLEGVKFERTTPIASKFINYSKYTSGIPRFYNIEDFWYVPNPASKLLKYVNIQGVFESPQEANSFKSCGNTTDCYNDYNFEYPMSASLSDTVVKLVIDEIKGNRMVERDSSNDAKDNN